MRKLTSLLGWLALATSSSAHELWIEPEFFQVDSGQPVVAELLNGQEFVGVSLPYATRSIVRLEAATHGELDEITGRLGDRPAIRISPEDGLLSIGYESKSQNLRYKDWAKFQAFADHKGFSNARAIHEERDLSFDEFSEGYTRFSKSLIGVGGAQGEPFVFGFEFEIASLDNPIISKDNVVPMRLLYQSSALADHQVEVFERSPDGKVEITYLQTDAEGIISIPTKSGHQYMLDAVYFREPSDELLERMDVDWETLWANLTFARPNGVD